MEKINLDKEEEEEENNTNKNNCKGENMEEIPKKPKQRELIPNNPNI